MRNRTLLLPVLVAVLLSISASAAQAGSFILTLTDVTRGDVYALTDNDVIQDADGLFAGDMNGAVDGIVFAGRVGAFDVQVFGNVFLPGPTSPVQMNLSNFLVSSALGGIFTATLSRTGVSGGLFGPAVFGVTQYGANFMSGTGNVRFQSWINGTSVLDANTSSTLDPAPPPAWGGPINLNGGDVSMLSTLTFDVSSGAELQADSALHVETANVPEPTTLLLFGPGMAGLAALRRRLRSKAV